MQRKGQEISSIKGPRTNQLGKEHLGSDRLGIITQKDQPAQDQPTKGQPGEFQSGKDRKRETSLG